MPSKSSAEKVSNIVSEVTRLLAQAKKSEKGRLSARLLALRTRVKATLSLDFDSDIISSSAIIPSSSSSMELTLTPTQQLSLWRAYGWLCDAWIDGIGMATMKKNAELREECVEKDKEIKALALDKYVLCDTKFNELTQRREEMELSGAQKSSMPRLRLRQSEESKLPLDFADASISSVTGDGRFDCTYDTEAMMASAKLSTADFEVEPESVDTITTRRSVVEQRADTRRRSVEQSADGSHEQSVTAFDWEPSVSSMTTTTMTPMTRTITPVSYSADACARMLPTGVRPPVSWLTTVEHSEDSSAKDDGFEYLSVETSVSTTLIRTMESQTDSQTLATDSTAAGRRRPSDPSASPQLLLGRLQRLGF